MIPLHPQPLRDFHYIGFYYYFLTWCCDHRQPLFTQPNQVDLLRGQFLRAEQETGFANIAYCFMPDHVHKVMKACSPTSDAGPYIKLAKQYSGDYYSKSFKRRVWQRYGYDRGETASRGSGCDTRLRTLFAQASSRALKITHSPVRAFIR